MSRSLKKGPYVEDSLLRKVQKMQAAGKKQPIKTWSRRSMVLPDFVGLTFAIHDGRLIVLLFLNRGRQMRRRIKMIVVGIPAFNKIAEFNQRFLCPPVGAV